MDKEDLRPTETHEHVLQLQRNPGIRDLSGPSIAQQADDDEPGPGDGLAEMFDGDFFLR